MTYIDYHENIDLIQTWNSMMQKRLWNEKILAHESKNQGGHFLDF